MDVDPQCTDDAVLQYVEDAIADVTGLIEDILRDDFPEGHANRFIISVVRWLETLLTSERVNSH